ncbi:MAG: hypothetical protein BGO49_30565 [Planctomycetales bacterium 71-10]|nr:MAG: hypothetical protein BGO49_30565 [Planctomycetales bacterium 71-10]
MKIFYIAGPGNVVGTYRHYLKGEHDPGQVAITYSGQFFDVCRELGLAAKVVTTYPDGDKIAADGIEIENWPAPWIGRRRAAYYLGSLAYHARLLAAIIASRADLVVHYDRDHWFLLAPLRLLGVKLLPTLHNRLWAVERPRRGLQGLLLRLNGWYFRRCSSGVMCISEDSVGELREVAGDALPVRTFCPSYPPGTFVDSPAPAEAPRRILFVGRVEVEKGALDLVDVAARLRDRGRRGLVFDVCGDGSALEEMKEQVRALGLEDSFHFRGYTGRKDLPGAFQASFAVVIPTRTVFAEGFNKVVVETILSGRPAVTSAGCLGSPELSGAVVLVPPDSVEAYADAIESLIDDPGRYDEVVRAGDDLRARFYDRGAGWGACLKGFLLDIFPALEARRGEAARADSLT